MPSQNASENRFLSAPLGRLFAANALPMMLIMVMNGLLTLIDAAFLGRYVGADALAAVGLVFPILMISIALSTLVSGGMSSLLARNLGAGDHDEAAAVVSQAQGLALFLSLLAIVAFAVGGGALISQLADGQPAIARMAHTYLGILILAMPVQMLLGVHADTWRNEGRAGLMALMSVGVTLANIALDYLLIVRLEMGVAGSAWGTALAQTLGLALLIGLRLQGGGVLPLAAILRARARGEWRAIMTLGAPLSLGFAGIALVSAVVITTLRLTAGADYAESVAAYGIVTRVFSFTFLPLMAISLATQAIVGNNFGAGLYYRATAALRLALAASFFYCLAVELTLLLGQGGLGGLFVTDAGVIAQVGRILRWMALFYVVGGPILVLAMYFQAIGNPARTTALTLVKPFLLSPLLIVGLGWLQGAGTIWLAFPLADALALGIALALSVGALRPRAAQKMAQ